MYRDVSILIILIIIVKGPGLGPAFGVGGGFGLLGGALPEAVVHPHLLQVTQGVEVHLLILAVHLALGQVAVDHELLPLHEAQAGFEGDALAHEVGGLVRQHLGNLIVGEFIGMVQAHEVPQFMNEQICQPVPVLPGFPRRVL